MTLKTRAVPAGHGVLIDVPVSPSKISENYLRQRRSPKISLSWSPRSCVKNQRTEERTSRLPMNEYERRYSILADRRMPTANLRWGNRPVAWALSGQGVRIERRHG